MVMEMREPDEERGEHAVEGCLAAAMVSKEIEFPQKDVITCGLVFCNARSDHIGELPCRHILDKRIKG